MEYDYYDDYQDNYESLTYPEFQEAAYEKPPMILQGPSISSVTYFNQYQQNLQLNIPQEIPYMSYSSDMPDSNINLAYYPPIGMYASPSIDSYSEIMQDQSIMQWVLRNYINL